MDFFPQAWIAKDTLNRDFTETVIHSICVSHLASKIARELGLAEDQCYELGIAGLLHDIGKMKLTGYLYGSDSHTLTVEKMKYVRMHANLSYQILQKYKYSDFILESVLYHHENYDGSGYPENRRGKDIPLGARIIRICDVFSALITNRPYRSAFDIDTAIELMIEEVKNYDMKLFLTFLKVVHDKEVEEIIQYCYQFKNPLHLTKMLMDR